MGVLAIGVLDEAEPEVVSVAEPLEPVVPEAPIEVPLPVAEPVVEPMLEPVPVVEPAVVSVLLVLGVVAMEPEPEVLPVLEPVLGDVVVLEVDGMVVEDDELAASSFLPQALRVRAAIRARAALCAIGDLIMGNSFRVVSGVA